MAASALVLANNDITQIAWRYDAKIPGCLGFAVYRKEGTPDGPSPWVPLPAWVGFVGQANPSWTRKTTEVWPVQKFEWKDLTAQRGTTYSYKIVPVSGNPSSQAPLTQHADIALVAGPATLTPQRGSFSTYFNRGILSTQFLSHAVPPGPSGAPNYKVLTDRIDQPGDPLRIALAGQILEGLESLLLRAGQEDGTVYAALYELTDPELVQLLLKNKKRLHLILSNTGTNDSENQPARQSLHDAGADITDRFVPSGHIGHNKFMIYVDAHGDPQSVLLGSTNWTDTAICAQTNNTLVVENSDLAQTYMRYWQRLKDDTEQARAAKQGPSLRDADAHPGVEDIAIDGASATVWFSPNTPHARQSHPSGNEATPPDLQQVFSLMDGAKEAILFLVFQPGSPSIVEKAAEAANNRRDLFVRGAATDPKAAQVYNTLLIHRAGEDPVEVVPASAITDQFAFWQHELLKAGPEAHAIIHDKIVVIDPMSDECVVITGSHNLGYRASYNNDENLLIVRGHKALAQAYAVHVMDIYDHYRFRYVIQKQGTQAFSGLEPDDKWQDKYFDPSNPASHDVNVWFSAGDTGNVTPHDAAGHLQASTKASKTPEDRKSSRAAIMKSRPEASRSQKPFAPAGTGK
jgi:phosphatidylserine/phosphatidylglycerophosphate/cardiolipin synthase-like enzyme